MQYDACIPGKGYFLPITISKNNLSEITLPLLHLLHPS